MSPAKDVQFVTNQLLRRVGQLILRIRPGAGIDARHTIWLTGVFKLGQDSAPSVRLQIEEVDSRASSE